MLEFGSCVRRGALDVSDGGVCSVVSDAAGVVFCTGIGVFVIDAVVACVTPVLMLEFIVVSCVTEVLV